MSSLSSISSEILSHRDDFPILKQVVNDRYPLVYLDSSATTQKPSCVIDGTSDFYAQDNANIHRAVYPLGERATERYEEAREKIAHFINAPTDKEVIFTRGATESINLVAQCFVKPLLSPGDNVVITYLEHHANIVPWQMITEEKSAELRVLDVDENGDLRLDLLPSLLDEKTKCFAFVHVSNALGTVNPIEDMLALAKKHNIPTLIDGSQAIAHQKVDVQALGCDFYVFSGHKLYGPTGIGVLWGKGDLLNAMPPYQGGGDMIEQVSFQKTTFAKIPNRFEAGTPNICGAVGLGIAVDYIQSIGIEKIQKHEDEVLAYGLAQLSKVPTLKLIGKPKKRAGAISFVIEGCHPQDVGSLLGNYGVAVRVGHHCAQPIIQKMGVQATVRASVGLYTNQTDFDRLYEALIKTIRLLSE